MYLLFIGIISTVYPSKQEKHTIKQTLDFISSMTMRGWRQERHNMT